ncbi:MAG: hypothetical protein D6703_05875 [Zetaproteobacteria bacterium]|nr:MAG: hypothetical protein D6703_05875 [Zetaproteobacteria bacterium]
MHNLCYTIDALSDSGKQAWRLQEDGSWRTCKYGESLKEGDKRITDVDEAEQWTGQRLKKTADGQLKLVGRPGKFDFWMRGIFAHAVPHRFHTPPIPQKNDLIGVVASLTPGIPWLVYLDTDGRFRALDTRSEPIIGNLDIAVRGEIASSSEYVGPDAACNEQSMNLLYAQFLGGWLEHLKTGQMGVFVPDPEKTKDIDSYLEALNAWQPR